MPLVFMRAPLFLCYCSTESTLEILQLSFKGEKQGITVVKRTLTNVPQHYTDGNRLHICLQEQTGLLLHFRRHLY